MGFPAGLSFRRDERFILDTVLFKCECSSICKISLLVLSLYWCFPLIHAQVSKANSTHIICGCVSINGPFFSFGFTFSVPKQVWGIPTNLETCRHYSTKQVWGVPTNLETCLHYSTPSHPSKQWALLGRWWAEIRRAWHECEAPDRAPARQPNFNLLPEGSWAQLFFCR